MKQLAFRGTYSKGFRAPTFAESGPRSQYAGFVTTTPPAAFQGCSRWFDQPLLAGLQLGSRRRGLPEPEAGEVA